MKNEAIKNELTLAPVDHAEFDLLDVETHAELSSCRKYRYDLWRIWDKHKPYLMIIGLNPSTADETKDDATIKRCKRFAFDWGFGGLCMVNLFAFRATERKDMLKYSDPIGEDNDKYLLKHSKKAGMILAAWGTDGVHLARNHAVKILLEKERPMLCLIKTKHGHPGHPLYIKADTKPELF